MLMLTYLTYLPYILTLHTYLTYLPYTTNFQKIIASRSVKETKDRQQVDGSTSNEHLCMCLCLCLCLC